jgi:hypothetical protein
VFVDALFQFIADALAIPLRQKLQRRLGGRTLWGYLRDGRPPVDSRADELPPLPPNVRRHFDDRPSDESD